MTRAEPPIVDDAMQARPRPRRPLCDDGRSPVRTGDRNA